MRTRTWITRRSRDEIMAEARTALVTGANRGIGLEVCRQLAALGHRVILTARDLSKAEAAAAAAPFSGGDVVAARLDVTDPASIRALAGASTVDVLVNNAAILLDEAERLWIAAAGRSVARPSRRTSSRPIAVSQAFVPAHGRARLRPHRQRIVRGRAAGVDEHVRAGVLDVEGRAERVHAPARGGDERHRRAGQQRVPGMGPNGHGRPRRAAVGRAGRGHDRRGLPRSTPGDRPAASSAIERPIAW